MKGFFLLVEFALPLLAIYWVIRKQSLAIVYIPFIMFSYHIIEKKLPGFFMSFQLIFLLLFFVIYNLPFVKKNIFSIIIFFYFLFLLKNNDQEFKEIRPFIVNVSWLFLGIGLIPYIYENNSREKIFREISFSAWLTMGIFSINTILSTLLKYNPVEGYGVTSGVMFGNISNDYYNIFPMALYLILRKGIRDRNLLYFAVYFVSVFFVLLTMRRSVMLLSVIATVIVMIELLDFKNIKQFIAYGVVIAMVSVIVISSTSFLDQLIERFEMRDLENRSLEKENRLLEFDLLYKDLFVYYDYDPWFGYGLNQSHGNYGKGKLGTRSLHTDFANITHSAGLLGLFLYLMMVSVAFWAVWKRTYSKSDKIQFFFISLCFLIYFINGRYITVNAMLMMFGILNLPLGKTKFISENKPLISQKSKLEIH